MNNLLGLMNLVAVLILSSCGQAPAQSSIAPEAFTDAPPAETAPLVEPTPQASASPTPSPSPAPTNSDNVISFGYFDSDGTCAAMEHWDPSTETVEFPVQIPCNPRPGVVCPAHPAFFTFGATGVTVTEEDGQTIPLTGPGAGQDYVISKAGVQFAPAVCTITVESGQLISVLSEVR